MKLSMQELLWTKKCGRLIEQYRNAAICIKFQPSFLIII